MEFKNLPLIKRDYRPGSSRMEDAKDVQKDRLPDPNLKFVQQVNSERLKNVKPK